MLTHSFFAITHLQRAPIIASSENVPEYRCSAYGRKYLIYNKNVSSTHFRKKIHISESYIVNFLLNIWNHGKNLHDLSGQNPCKKWWTGVTFGHYHDFHGLKLSYLFSFISKIVI